MGDEVKTLSEGGAAPESRITDATEAHTLAQALIREDNRRAIKRATVQGQLDGNPPYDADELERLGQGYRTNLNTREAKSNHNARRTTYYELIMEVPCLFEVTVKGADQPLMDFGQVIAEEAHNIAWKWDSFLYNMQLHQDQIISFGAGPILFPDDVDWRFEAVEMGAVHVPRDSKSDTGSLDCCAIVYEYKAHELYRYIRDKEAKEAAEVKGWDPDQIKTAIIDASTRGTGSTTSDWETIQKRIKNSDLTAGHVHFHPVYVVHLLYREFSGRITHAIILDTGDKAKNGKFLFRQIGRFASWQNALHLFLAEIGTNGKYHSVRGLDQETYAHCNLNDRLTSQVVDAAITAGTLLIQPGSTGMEASKFRVARVGPFTVVPPGLEMLKQDFNPQLQGLTGVLTLMRANLAAFAGLESAMPEEQGQGRVALGIEKLRLTREGKLERGLISFYYHQVDLLLREIARRLLNPGYTRYDGGYELRQEFLARCLARGVPPDLLNIDRLEVCAARSIGYGSAAMKRMDSDWLLGMAPHMDEIGKARAFRTATAARLGWRQVDQYFPPFDRSKVPTSEHSLANLENNDMRQGNSVVVGVDQPHIVHMSIHVPPLMQLAEGFTRGRMEMDLNALFTYFDAALQHVALHLDYTRGDSSREIEYRAFLDAYQDLVRVYNQIQGEVRRQSQQQQAAQQAQMQAVQEALAKADNREYELRLRELQGELQLKAQKEANMDAIRQEKARNQAQIARRMADLREELMRRQAATKEQS